MTFSTKLAESELSNKGFSSNQTEIVNLSELSQSISFESALFGLLSIVKEPSNGIEIKESSFFIPAQKKDTLTKISFLMEVICNIPFSFEYNARSDKFYFDFGHLLPEINKVL